MSYSNWDVRSFRTCGSIEQGLMSHQTHYRSYRWRGHTHAAVDVRRPSFPGCRLASLEQSATSRHVCKVTACFLQSSEDSSLQPQFSLTILLCLRSGTRHYGHINRCSYLLTYMDRQRRCCVYVVCQLLIVEGGGRCQYKVTVSECALAARVVWWERI